MFSWFIRQKNLVPSELFDKEALGDILKKFNPDSMDEDNYYRAILQNLFFATFNTPQDGGGKIARRWINADTDENGNGMGLSGDYNVATVYRYRNEFRNPDSFIALMKKVPFLNCALFDCLDKIEDKEDGGRKLYFDGFSTRAKRQAHVPNGLFFGNGDDGRLGIISLFSEYEFTIDENDADDADVSLDPELLGKVFENLLGAFNPETQETARKATGSFYTPREIVDYMVEESLKSYLRGRCGRAGRASLPGNEVGSRVPRDRNDDFDAKLDNLFDKAKTAERAPTEFSRDEEKAILDALYSAKIIDPACGSGAFPMGVLHCMIRLMKRLDPDSTSIRAHLLARYKADKAANDPAETAEERKDRLAELERRLEEGQHYPDYERKLYLIENCIYGVDIQPIAAQISKLRFFISLLCDQFRTSYDLEKENYGLLSLPNLEAKFVCGNTLISLPDTGSELDLTVGDVHRLREELVRNRHRLFGARSTKTKEKYKARDKEIRHAIKAAVMSGLAKPDEKKIAIWEAQIEKAQKERKKIEMPDWQEIAKPVQSDFFAETTVQPMLMKIDRNADKRDAIDREIKGLERSIEKERDKASKANVSAAQDYAKLVSGWDPFDQNSSSPFFDPKWMFNIADGFDVVIGNPPYVEAKKLKVVVASFREKYECASGTADLSVYFYERGICITAPCGILAYICTNKFFSTEYGAKLRKFLRGHDLLRVLNFEQCEVFEDILVSSAITIVGNNRPDERETIGYKSFRNLNHNDFKISFVRDVNVLDEYPLLALTEKEWSFADTQKLILKAKIENAKKCIGDISSLHVYRGVTTGFNPAFIVSDAKKSELVAQDPNCASLIKNMLQGRNIRKWVYNESDENLLQTGYDIDVKKKYPSIYKHLFMWQNELKLRTDQGLSWWNLRACKYYSSFESDEKIIWGLTADKWAFAYDDRKHYLPSNGYILTSDDMPVKYLLGLLNSRLLLFYFGFIGIMTAGGAYTLKAATIESLPIPTTTVAQQKPIIALVDRILAAKKQDPQADTTELEAQIDRLVYKLYGITDEKEIAVIEGRKMDEGTNVEKAKLRQDAALPDSSRIATTPPRRRRNDDDEMLD